MPKGKIRVHLSLVNIGRSINLFWVFVILLWSGILIVSPVEAGEWRQAVLPYDWEFPRDHGSHPEYLTEWWYFQSHTKLKVTSFMYSNL